MTIFYTILRDSTTNKILGSSLSPQSPQLTKSILKELKDFPNTKKITKTESRINNTYFFVICVYKNIIFSVIVDRYEEDSNVTKYIYDLYAYVSKSSSVLYDDLIREKSDEYNKDKTLRIVDETKNILADSLNLVVHRGENVDNLSRLVNKLNIETKQMHTSIKNMKFNTFISKYGFKVGVAIILLILLYYIMH